MIKKSKIIFFVSLFLNLFFLWNNAVLKAEDDESARFIVGETKIFSTRAPLRVVIGNPSIADIAEVTNSEITVTAKSPGVTTLLYWDAFGEQSVRIKVVQEDMQEIKLRVDNLLDKLGLPEVYTRAEEDEGKVILLGRVKSSQERERIAVALGPLSKKTVDLIEVKEEESVVEIDVQILELNKDATHTLGFTWPGSITLNDASGPTTTAVTGLKNVFHVSDFTRSAFNVTLDALIQDGLAKVLSRPRISCQSGKEAQLLVGGEKPIFTTTVAGVSGAQGTAIQYKEFGIKLKVKPYVTQEKRIKLSVNVEVSEVGAADIIGPANAPTAKAFPLNKRTAYTELLLNDGQTMAIGGLIKQKTEEDIRKTAGLGDLPLLGAIFRKKTEKIGGGQGERGNVELFITLTPTITSEGKKAAEPSKEVRAKVSYPSQSDISLTPAMPSEGKIATEAGKEMRAKLSYPNVGVTSATPLEPISEYAKIIQKRVLENLIYPSLARAAGFQGKVKLSLHLSYRGELLEAKVKESSGYKIFDEQAVNVAKGIAFYPPFPSSIAQNDLWIDVPIMYQLD